MRFKIAAIAALAVFAAALPALAQSVKLLNPNTASQAELNAVVPSAVTDVILAKRPFAAPTNFDAALASANLNADQRRGVYSKVFVPLNLNTATEQDMLLIPGMKPNLVTEFKEYRPYKVIGQFRHEIGKYITKEQVAYLESYVFVPGK